MKKRVNTMTPAIPRLFATLCLLSLGAFPVGCEDHDTIGGKIVDAVSDGDDKASSSLSGTWRGTSGSGHYSTVVTLSDNNGALSGSLKWSWGGVRRFSGTRSGNSVQWTTEHDREGVSDHWVMTLSSDRKRLTGHANKTDGGGYSISLSR